MSSDNTDRPVQKAEFEKVLDKADVKVAEFRQEGESLLKRLQNALHSHPTAIPGVVLIVSVVFFSLLIGGRFLHPFNFSLIVQQVMIIGIVGIAQTLVILTAGIDLSVGAIMVLSSVVMGKFAVDLGIPAPLAIAAGIGVGALCGLVNGLLVTRFRLPPFIVTLGTWNIFFALNLWYSASETIRAQDIEEKAPLLIFFGQSVEFLGARLTYGSIAMLLMIAACWYVLNLTAWGRHVQAVGDDTESANLAGIRTDRTLLQVYVIAGIICGIAAWALIGRIGSVSPQAGQTANLDSITAVVIGGTSLFGGRGSIIGTLLGALIVGVFRNGLALSGVNVLWQEFAVGVLIIVAVAVDQWLRRVSR
ncbi:MAG: ABC transporter permease [Proteobacteria bacterium]|nr:ABC transporter permease [Pseudomonadota bacterium]